MKNLWTLIPACCLIMLLTSCHHGNSIIISNGDDNLSISYSGDIKFNDQETAILSMTPDSYLKYKKNDRRLIAECDYHGKIQYELYDGDRKLITDDEEGKKFIAFAIQDMIDVGFDAKGRINRLYKKGGNREVLAAVDNLKSDYLKSLYLQFLLESDSLAQGDVKQIIKKAGSQLGSDYEKGNLLDKIPAVYLRDSATSHSWMEAVRTIGSDFEKSNALKYAARQQLTLDQFDDIIDVTQSVGSDFEKANILKVLIGKSAFADTNIDKTMDAINNVGSDFERENLLRELMEKERATAPNFDRMLDAISRVGSDFDKGNLVKDLIHQGIPAGSDFDKLMSVINHMGGDFDRINLIKDVVSKNIETEKQWMSIINAAAEISSDFDKSNLLVEIAPGMPKSDDLKTAYTKAAKTINSEQEYGRVMKAID